VKITNPTKAGLALAAMVMLTVLMSTNAIAPEAGTGLLGSIVGYIIGNGVGSKAGLTADRLIEMSEK
jgi:membrane protein YqaA with SNARE-associated domain